jgi:hypothetical protein
MKSNPLTARWKLLLPALIAVLFAMTACGSDDGAPAANDVDPAQFFVDSEKIFSSADMKAIGWKSQKDLLLEYPESTEATWGYLNTKEVAILVYPSAEVARVQGLAAAKAQTAVGEDGQATGEIDRISCRDAQGQSAVGLLDVRESLGDPHMVRVSFTKESSDTTFEPRVCSNKYPTYTDYRIIGNMVVLCEGEGRTGDEPSKNCQQLPAWLSGN